MKFLIIADLHGRMPRILFKEFDAIIVPGDICSDKEFRPLKDEWVRAFSNKKTEKGLDAFIRDKIGKKRMHDLDIESIRIGRKILEHLDSFGKPIFIVPGNWDQSYGKSKIKDPERGMYDYYKSFLDGYLGKRINPRLTRGLKNIRDCQFKIHHFGDIDILGYGLSSNREDIAGVKGINKKERAQLNRAYRKIIAKLDETYKKRKNKTVLFLTHNVPYNTKLDVVNKRGPLYRKHLGSMVARQFILQHKPLVCIGGHMHEHFGKQMLGKTTVINSGFGPKVNTLLEIEGTKIKKLRFMKA